MMSFSTDKRYSVDELRAIVAPLAKKYGVKRVYVFGSVARGDCNENSDYDFYIELTEVWGLFRLSSFFQDLRDAVGCEIDLLDSVSVNPDLLNVIMSEGLIVYEE